MKSQIVPLLFFCITFPWIASRVFQMEGRHETLHESVRESRDMSRPIPAAINFGVAGQQVIYGELSTKQINYLIP
jgi:hypothetical protein